MIKNIKTLYLDAMDIMDELGIKTGKIQSVLWNSRLRSVWGRCTYNRKFNTYKIELNPILAGDDVSWEDAMNTMIHEVLHAHKDRMCHTGEWKRCAELVNKEYPIYNITRCTSAEEKGVADKMTRTANYTVKCNQCGHTYTYTRAGKVVKLIQTYPTNHGCRCVCGSSNLSLI